MPKITLSQTNFTAGELSPKLRGRGDIARYQNGAEKVRDLIVQVYGGVKRRPGTLFVRETKNSANRAVLIEFVKDADTAYLLEFGNGYMRVYKDGAVVMSGGSPYEVVSPYTTAQVLELDYTQGSDTMFLFHEDVAPRKLVCAGDTAWTLSTATFVQAPFEDPGTNPNATLYPSKAGAVGERISLAVGTLGTAVLNDGYSWTAGVGGVRTDPAHGLASGDYVLISNAVPDGYNAVAVATVSTATEYTFPLDKHPGTLVFGGNTQKITGTSVFAAGDVGSAIKVNGGIVRITSVVSDFVVRGLVLQALSSAVEAAPDAWSLHAPAWSSTRGYPRTGTLHEQRLIVAGSPTFPQTLWGSVTGAYLDFTPGVNDDDAFAHTIASDIANPVQFVAAGRALAALTSSGEFTAEGGVEKPITPTNVRIKQRKNFGCARVRPVRVGDSELFAQRAGKKLRSFGYALANDEWTAPDLSVLADHLAAYGIADMTWQQEPVPLVWIVTDDGKLMSITLDRDQDVVAWAWHEEFGQPDADGNATAFAESVACIPTADGDEVWLIVRRTIDGSTVRYVERLSEDTTLDCAITSSGSAATVWGGLDHLEGETVHIVGDGSYRGTKVVSGGEVTLDREASEVNIGLNYRPRLKLLPPEVQGPLGSATGNAMRTSEVTMRFHETTGCTVNGNAVTFRKTGSGALDTAPEPFTGVKRVENLGFERGVSDIEIVQEEPMPFHLLSVTRKFTFNEG